MQALWLAFLERTLLSTDRVEVVPTDSRDPPLTMTSRCIARPSCADRRAGVNSSDVGIGETVWDSRQGGTTPATELDG